MSVRPTSGISLDEVDQPPEEDTPADEQAGGENGPAVEQAKDDDEL